MASIIKAFLTFSPERFHGTPKNAQCNSQKTIIDLNYLGIPKQLGDCVPTERTEDYLEALIYIIEEKGFAKVKDVSEYLSISPSSVTEMFQKLKETGFINYEKYRGVTLTKKGLNVANKTKKRHETLREFLCILGVPESIANEDACRIEHVINPETMKRLTKFVSFVKDFKERPHWLNHFNHYYKTGKHFEYDGLEKENFC
ncbi:MAG: iron dependent repressor, metal binding and dimerization domain protein, partial [Candidatus Thermoplasmatota archaeon]|nr:iron dependent repressor, metal binding and dimerization domain protein [Candidatus Thermoplasmatota archaeon]